MNTTIRGESADAASFWSDHATILRREAADGVFHGLATLHSGSFADMVRMFARMPESDRETMVIEKSGDRQYNPAEIMALLGRSDIPA